MRLYKFQYTEHKDGYQFVWIPGHSEKCAQHKASTLKVVKSERDIPVVVAVSQEMNKDWR
jgi:hypothetical protein